MCPRPPLSHVFVTFLTLSAYIFPRTSTLSYDHNLECVKVDLKELEKLSLTYPLPEDVAVFTMEQWEQLKILGKHIDDEMLKDKFYRGIRVLVYVLKKYHDKNENLNPLNPYREGNNVNEEQTLNNKSESLDLHSSSRLKEKFVISTDLLKDEDAWTETMLSQASQKEEVRDMYQKEQSVNKGTVVVFQPINISSNTGDMFVRANQRYTIPTRTTTSAIADLQTRNWNDMPNKGKFENDSYSKNPDDYRTIMESQNALRNASVTLETDIIDATEVNEANSLKNEEHKFQNQLKTNEDYEYYESTTMSELDNKVNSGKLDNEISWTFNQDEGFISLNKTKLTAASKLKNEAARFKTSSRMIHGHFSKANHSGLDPNASEKRSEVKLAGKLQFLCDNKSCSSETNEEDSNIKNQVHNTSDFTEVGNCSYDHTVTNPDLNHPIPQESIKANANSKVNSPTSIINSNVDSNDQLIITTRQYIDEARNSTASTSHLEISGTMLENSGNFQTTTENISSTISYKDKYIFQENRQAQRDKSNNNEDNDLTNYSQYFKMAVNDSLSQTPKNLTSTISSYHYIPMETILNPDTYENNTNQNNPCYRDTNKTNKNEEINSTGNTDAVLLKTTCENQTNRSRTAPSSQYPSSPDSKSIHVPYYEHNKEEGKKNNSETSFFPNKQFDRNQQNEYKKSSFEYNPNNYTSEEGITVHNYAFVRDGFEVTKNFNNSNDFVLNQDQPDSEEDVRTYSENVFKTDSNKNKKEIKLHYNQTHLIQHNATATPTKGLKVNQVDSEQHVYSHNHIMNKHDKNTDISEARNSHTKITPQNNTTSPTNSKDENQTDSKEQDRSQEHISDNDTEDITDHSKEINVHSNETELIQQNKTIYSMNGLDANQTDSKEQDHSQKHISDNDIEDITDYSKERNVHSHETGLIQQNVTALLSNNFDFSQNGSDGHDHFLEHVFDKNEAKENETSQDTNFHSNETRLIQQNETHSTNDLEEIKIDFAELDHFQEHISDNNNDITKTPKEIVFNSYEIPLNDTTSLTNVPDENQIKSNKQINSQEHTSDYSEARIYENSEGKTFHSNETSLMHQNYSSNLTNSLEVNHITSEEYAHSLQDSFNSHDENSIKTTENIMANHMSILPSDIVTPLTTILSSYNMPEILSTSFNITNFNEPAQFLDSPTPSNPTIDDIFLVNGSSQNESVSYESQNFPVDNFEISTSPSFHRFTNSNKSLPNTPFVVAVEARIPKHSTLSDQTKHTPSSRPDNYEESGDLSNYYQDQDSYEGFVHYLSPVSRHHSQYLPLPSPAPQDFRRLSYVKVPQYVYNQAHSNGQIGFQEHPRR